MVKQSGEALAVFSQRGDAGAKAVSVDSKVLLAQRSASPLPRGATAVRQSGLGGFPKEELPLA
ncbi:hypothetical protein [Dendronalium sp. ChiSLP03b]|uniref:hypothetical protein n=1 Tax=Dendronalium sp. ChiSLP03b TaxID=3075381 RepID=UPI002AD2D17C|nr:hypothetical protein [Dendronalium sp. ChiSLP03b]MDZ8207753.1 hypothetical protein [Dendronalium sp. ChiSLP03b]